MSQAAAAAVWRIARNAYKRDRANRYALLEPWPLPELRLSLPAYHGPLIHVDALAQGRSRVTVRPYGGDTCDGATFSPDSPKGAIPGALFHDAWYAEIPAIARAWGWTEERVRKLGDEILSTVMLRAGSSGPAARLYFNAVWFLGGAFRRVRRLLPLLAVAASVLCIAGGSGCLSPPDLSDPDAPYTPPAYEKTR